MGIFRGGPSPEHEVSLKTGGNVISAILQSFPDKYQIKDIFITKNGEWYMDGLLVSRSKVFTNIDVAFNALHGNFGEDGKIQQIFDSFNIPYASSGVAASLLGMDKVLSKKVFAGAGIKVPRGVSVSDNQSAKDAALEVLRVLGPSWVVKPSSSGSSLGVSVANGFNELVSAISGAFQYGQKVLIEERVVGREATCGVVEKFRGRDYYSSPVVEIIFPVEKCFFDTSFKYNGKATEICPSGFSRKVKEEIERIAVLAHKTLNCKYYSRSDFIVSEKGIYLLEINTLPGLTTESLLPKSLEAIGVSLPHFLDHLITLALENR